MAGDNAQFPNALPIGSMLMEYRLESVLGVGGFGITYLASDTLLEKQVAIKEYFPSSAVSRGKDMTVTLAGPDMQGEYELGLDDQPTKRFKAGEVFYEPTGCLHRVSRNPSKTGRTKLIAVVLHPREVNEIAIPDKSK